MPSKTAAEMPDPFLDYDANIVRIYKQALIDLRSAIEKKFGGGEGVLKKFIAYTHEIGEPIGETNLYKVFSPDNPQQMSLALFIRLSRILGLGGDKMKNQRIPSASITLLDYLSLDNTMIWQSILTIQYQDYSDR